MQVSEEKCWTNVYLWENLTNTAFMYFLQSAFKNQLEKVRLSLGTGTITRSKRRISREFLKSAICRQNARNGC